LGPHVSEWMIWVCIKSHVPAPFREKKIRRGCELGFGEPAQCNWYGSCELGVRKLKEHLTPPFNLSCPLPPFTTEEPWLKLKMRPSFIPCLSPNPLGLSFLELRRACVCPIGHRKPPKFYRASWQWEGNSAQAIRWN